MMVLCPDNYYLTGSVPDFDTSPDLLQRDIINTVCSALEDEYGFVCVAVPEDEFFGYEVFWGLVCYNKREPTGKARMYKRQADAAQSLTADERAQRMVAFLVKKAVQRAEQGLLSLRINHTLTENCLIVKKLNDEGIQVETNANVALLSWI